MKLSNIFSTLFSSKQPTSPTPTQTATFVPRYPMTAESESSVFRTQRDPYAVGAISSGKGDLGGKSYGVYQFASNEAVSSALRDFVNWPKNTLGSHLKKAGTLRSVEFDGAWRALALSNNREFGLVQENFAREVMWAPLIEKFTKYSTVDLTKRSDKLVDLVIGTVNQYGGLVQGIAKYVADNGGNSLSDNQVGILMQNYKLANVERHFRSSSAAVHRGIKNRIIRERKAFE